MQIIVGNEWSIRNFEHKKNYLCVLRNVSNHAYHSRKSFGILNVFGNNRNQQMNNSKIFDNFKLKIAGIN